MANMTFKASLLPNTDLGYSLGSDNKRWNIYGSLHGDAEKLKNIDGRRVNGSYMFGDGYLRYYLSSGSMTSGYPGVDGFILHGAWDWAGGYDAQLCIGNVGHCYVRSGRGGGNAEAHTQNWTDWFTILDSDNYASIIDGRYVNVTGDTMTGRLTFDIPKNGSNGINAHTTNNTWSAIDFLDTNNDGYGIGVRIGAGGLAVIGAGESSTSFVSNVKPNSGSETLYALSDGEIFIESTCDTIANRKGIKISNGNVIPVVADANSDNTLTLGAPAVRWKRIYGYGFGQDDGMTIQPGHSNEVNFGGTNTQTNIYFGYRAVDSRPIPTKFIFGGSTGTADIQIKTAYLGSGTSSYVSSTYYTGNAASANALKDRSNSTLTYANYGAAGLAASAMTWMTCWNGYELRAISKAETANAVDSAHKWVRIGGDTMTGNLTIQRSVTTANVKTQPAAIYLQVKATDATNAPVAGGFLGCYQPPTPNNYNAEMVIYSTGGMYIGGGESASTIHQANTSGTATEDLYCCADGSIRFYPGADNKTEHYRMNTSVFYPLAKSHSLGGMDANYHWWKIYVGGPTTNSNAINAATPSIEFSNTDRSQYVQLVYTDYDSVRSPDGLTLVGNQANSYFQAPRVFGAVWNDYAEYRETKEDIQPGRCIVETGKGDLILSTERLQAGCEIVSDTFGFAIGETNICKTPTACAGRVLAYLYEDNNLAFPGQPVCSGPNGTVSLMTHEEEKEWPSRIIGTVSEIPDYEEWEYGSADEHGIKNKLKVDGRIWIRVR